MSWKIKNKLIKKKSTTGNACCLALCVALDFSLLDLFCDLPLSLSMPQYDQLSGGHLMGHVGSKMNYQAWMSPSSPAGRWSHLRYQVLEAEDGGHDYLNARWWDLSLSIFVLHYPFHPWIQEEHKLQGSCWLRSWYFCFPLWSIAECETPK